MKSREELIDQIVELELKMFLAVPAQGKALCRQHPDHFRLHRRAQIATWSPATLTSYLDDLHQAKASGHNLMTLKYARMDNLLPRKNAHPLIDKIVDILCREQREFIARYPNITSGKRPLSSGEDTPTLIAFGTYLRSELETYSKKTLELLYQDIQRLRADDMSMPEATYRHLARQWGFPSLEDMEQTIAEQRAAQPS
jgi:hypothetical protein